MDWKLIAIFLSNFLCCLTYDVIAPFYPVEAQHLGISHFETGLVFTFMPLAGFLAAPVIGSTMYKVGRRWAFTAGTVIMVSFTQAVSMAFMGLADLFPVYWFFALSLLARALSGVGTAFVYTVCKLHIAYAYIASDYPENMNELIAFTETFSGFGLVIGPVIGAGFYVLAGFEGVFASLSIIYIIGSIAIYFFLSADKPYLIKDEDNDISHLIRQPSILINCLPIVCTMIAIGFCDTVMGPHFETYGATPLQVGFLWALADSGYMIFSCILAKMLDLFNLKIVNLVGIGLVLAGYFLLTPWTVLFPRDMALVVVGLTFMSLAIACHYIAALPNLIQVAEGELRLVKDDILIDSLSALIASSTCLGEMLGPVIAGFTVDLTSFEDATVFFGLSEVLVLVVYLAYFFSSRSRLAMLPNSCKDSLLTAD